MRVDKQVETPTEISNISEDTQNTSSRGNQTSNMKNALEPKQSNKFHQRSIYEIASPFGLAMTEVNRVVGNLGGDGVQNF